MQAFINHKKNIVFWWSAKCGCSTVKTMMLQTMGLPTDDLHTRNAYGGVSNLDNNQTYIHIAFVRNIFHRFVSGVFDKHIHGQFSRIYKPINFIDATKNINLLEKHHFAPQTSENFNSNIKMDYIYDINNINYSELSQVCNFEFKPIHQNQNDWVNSTALDITNIDTLPYEQLWILKKQRLIPPYKYFYSNQETINNINLFYQQDIAWFHSIGMEHLCQVV